jgi:hypothetical protein
MRHIWISASVGRQGVNTRGDVSSVQQLINDHLPAPLRPLSVDGLCGPHTIAAIEQVQRSFLRIPHPDGRINPNGPTLRALNGAKAAPKVPAPIVGPIPPDVIQAARESQNKWKVPIAVTLGQWALESDFGHSMPNGSNNPFGIKALPGQPFVAAATHEIINGHDVVVIQHFRKFPSISAAFDEHGRLLATAPQFSKARLVDDDPDAFLHGLQSAGQLSYSTDPNYEINVKRRMKDNNLYKFGVSPFIPGTWFVEIGVYTWIYNFSGSEHAQSGTARWNNTPRNESGTGKWTLENPDPDLFLEINWDPNRYSPGGSRELWKPPLRDNTGVSTTGTLITTPGGSVAASKMSDISPV